MIQVVIEIDENVFTRLFDNRIEDYTIVNDDLFDIAKSIRKGVPIFKFLEELKQKSNKDDVLERVVKTIERYKLRIPPTVYDELVADIVNVEGEE